MDPVTAGEESPFAISVCFCSSTLLFLIIYLFVSALCMCVFVSTPEFHFLDREIHPTEDLKKVSFTGKKWT